MNWLIHSDAGLIARILAGGFIFLCLALADLKKHGRAATRWREYAFLFACTVAAMVYGIVNDQITSTISWEYFYYGKSLERQLGLDVPPASGALHWQAAKIGMQATWSVGLLLGAAMLIANNPRRHRARIPYRTMLALLPRIMLVTIGFAIIGGMAGSLGWLNWASPDFREMWSSDMFRPRRFIGVWGVHLGGYVGGIVGSIYAVCCIVKERRLQDQPSIPSQVA